MVYERFYKGKTTHFVRKSEADLVSNAVWEPGQGDKIRAQDLEESNMKKSSTKTAIFRVLTPNFLKAVYNVV